ncbi:hypothetical protein NMY22_g9574 [Coprinellus aureogranulatus]|nr:hypothetical protein NMY22_g9574 [Coprinellus aureogranulatus]
MSSSTPNSRDEFNETIGPRIEIFQTAIREHGSRSARIQLAVVEGRFEDARREVDAESENGLPTLEPDDFAYDTRPTTPGIPGGPSDTRNGEPEGIATTAMRFIGQHPPRWRGSY